MGVYLSGLYPVGASPAAEFYISTPRETTISTTYCETTTIILCTTVAREI